MPKQNQTKMNETDREYLRDFRNAQKGVHIFHFPSRRICVALKRTGSTMGAFSVAIASATETKYRKKVGELLARQRFEFGQTLPVVLGEVDFYGYAYANSEDSTLVSVAETIASALCAAI